MEDGAAFWGRRKIDASAVGLDDLLDDGQSEPGSLGFCRLEQAEWLQVRRKARPRVRDGESHLLGGGNPTDSGISPGPRPIASSAFFSRCPKTRRTLPASCRVVRTGRPYEPT